MKAKPARVDADKTAKPMTRIVHHINPENAIFPGMTLHNPEYEDEVGDRIPLAEDSTFYCNGCGSNKEHPFIEGTCAECAHDNTLDDED